jgi:hypothetical protein
MTPTKNDAFVRSVVLKRDDVVDFDAYPFSIPAIPRYEETEVFELTRSFLGDRGQFLPHLFED